MRPLKLVFEGLNSFEKRQEIDFSRLISARLFGIFGPTGAGKSTILDAITLALYGNVERASRGTNGILNTNCERLNVSFTFGLDESEKMRVYRAERTYVRKEDKETGRVSLDCRKCALVRIEDDGKEIVICGEKASAMNTAVENMLGLKNDDFTRTVVLPQGKFAEFLKLTNAPRREMMERLFHLEEYGDTLNRRVKEKEQQVAQELSTVTGQLTELAGATEDELKSAKVDRRIKGEDLESAQKKLSDSAKAYEELKTAYDLSEQYKTWNAQKILFDSKRGEIAHLKSEFDGAQRSSQVLPVRNELIAKKKSQAELTTLYHQTEHSMQKYDQLLRMTEQDYDVSTARLHGIIAQEQKRSGMLSGMVRDQEEISRLLAGEKALTAAIEEKTKEHEYCLAKLQKLKESIAAGEQYLHEQQEIADRAHKIDFETLQRGAEAEKHMKEKQTAFGEALEKQTQAQRELETVQSDLDAAKETEAKAQEAYALAEEAYAAAEKEFLALTGAHAASLLAKDLTDGTPCPVCGAVHHPQLAASDVVIADDRPAAAKARDEARSARDNAYLASADLGSKAKALEEQLESLSQNTEKLSDELMRAIAEWEGYRAELRCGELEQEFAAEKKRISDAVAAQQQINKANEKLTAYQRNEKNIEMQALISGNEATKKCEDLEEMHKRSESWHRKLEEAGLSRDADIAAQLAECESLIAKKQAELARQEESLRNARKLAEDARNKFTANSAALKQTTEDVTRLEKQLAEMLAECRFASEEEALAAARSPERIAELDKKLAEDRDLRTRIEENLSRITKDGIPRDVAPAEMQKAENENHALTEKVNALHTALGELDGRIARLTSDLERKKELTEKRNKLDREHTTVSELRQLLKGGKLVEFISRTYLENITRQASDMLMKLSGGHFMLELDADEFMVRDLTKGGTLRPTSNLSGGETFLVSLSLALSLSMHVNMHGKPMGFFFLDEGFGSLDGDLLNIVLDSLQKLTDEHFTVGVISHVASLQERIPAQIVVENTKSGSSAKVVFN